VSVAVPPPRRRARPASPWFLAPPPPSAAGLLFAFPYSGCGASMFRAWPGEIGGFAVVPLQLPGRENRLREGHFGTYEQLADAAADGLAPLLTRPYAVFGHCGGALPAFETVLRIAERGLPLPTRVFVSSQVAPQDGPRGRFLELDRAGLGTELRVLLAETGGAPTAELLELYLDVLVADVDANKAYHRPAPAQPLPVPLTAIGWDADVEVRAATMGGWGAWGPTRRELLAGTHYSFLSAPDDLCAALERDLADQH
jgi:surfactin synthase thioesterase subunit